MLSSSSSLIARNRFVLPDPFSPMMVLMPFWKQELGVGKVSVVDQAELGDVHRGPRLISRSAARMPAYRKVHACYKVCSAGQTFSSMPELVASRRSAVGLAGCAPRFVPNRGRPALIPDTFSPCGPARSACPQKPRACSGRGVGGLAVPLTVSRRSRRQGRRARACASWRPSATPDCLRCAVSRKGRAIPPGNLSGVHHEQRTHHCRAAHRAAGQ